MKACAEATERMANAVNSDFVILRLPLHSKSASLEPNSPSADAGPNWVVCMILHFSVWTGQDQAISSVNTGVISFFVQRRVLKADHPDQNRKRPAHPSFKTSGTKSQSYGDGRMPLSDKNGSLNLGSVRRPSSVRVPINTTRACFSFSLRFNRRGWPFCPRRMGSRKVLF